VLHEIEGRALGGQDGGGAFYPHQHIAPLYAGAVFLENLHPRAGRGQGENAPGHFASAEYAGVLGQHLAAKPGAQRHKEPGRYIAGPYILFQGSFYDGVELLH
jgi:hypothetical protein